MTTCDPSGRWKFGLPASWFMPMLATITPAPVAMELAMSGALGSPLEAWMSVSASGSCSGLAGPAGVNGHDVFDWPPAVGFPALGVAVPAAGAPVRLWSSCVGSGESGTISATAGLLRNRLTSADETWAATASGATRDWTLVPPWAVMSEVTGVWLDRAAARRWLAWV